jgi:hypothetical protein
MPYVLVMLFLASTGPSRLDHVDSIRFDSQKACESAEQAIRANALLAHALVTTKGADQTVSMKCLPAS